MSRDFENTGRWLLISPIAALLTICAFSSAQAATVLNNFGPGDAFSNSGRILEGPNFGSIGDVNQAASFTVGPSSTLLTSVSLGIFVNDSPAIGTGPMDVVGSPGAALRTLPINVNSTGKQVITAHNAVPSVMPVMAELRHSLIGLGILGVGMIRRTSK